MGWLVIIAGTTITAAAEAVPAIDVLGAIVEGEQALTRMIIG